MREQGVDHRPQGGALGDGEPVSEPRGVVEFDRMAANHSLEPGR
jgi:hypothetical protein